VHGDRVVEKRVVLAVSAAHPVEEEVDLADQGLEEGVRVLVDEGQERAQG
jgi:hypothetical protein